MAPPRALTWRGSIFCATLWLTLAVASTLEVYDGVPPEDSDFNNMYQDNNYLDTGPAFRNPDTQSKPSPEELLLNDLLKAWHLKMDYRQKWNSMYLKPKLATEDRNPGLQKVGIVKRLVDVLRDSRMQYRPSHSLRPQQKWKIKKGKLMGSQMVCYFKLCAFRSPA